MDWSWSWTSSILATWCEELTHWKRPWHWEGLKTGGEGDDRGWDGWIASPTWWAQVLVSSGSWWWTGRPGVLQFMGSQRVGHDWELNWIQMMYRKLTSSTSLYSSSFIFCLKIFPLHVSNHIKQCYNFCFNHQKSVMKQYQEEDVLLLPIF